MRVLNYILVKNAPDIDTGMLEAIKQYNRSELPQKSFEALKLMRNREGRVTVILVFSNENHDTYQPYTMKRYIGQSLDTPVTS